MTHPRTDSTLTDQEQDEQRDSIRNELDARPLTRGVEKAPAGSHAVDAPRLSGQASTSGSPSPSGAAGGLAQMAAQELRSALNHLAAARALMDDGESPNRLPSPAFAHVSFARENADRAVRDVESALSDVEKGNWP